MVRAAHACLRTPTSSHPWRLGNEITESLSIILRKKNDSLMLVIVFSCATKSRDFGALFSNERQK